MEKIIYIGMILLFIAILLIFIGSIVTTIKGEKSNIKSAGGIFIGPFPVFGFFTDKKMFYILIALMIIILIIWLITRRLI